MENLTQDAVIEAAILVSLQPITTRQLRSLFDPELSEKQVRAQLDKLQKRWAGRGLQLIEVANGWRFQSTAAMRGVLQRLNREAPQKYPASTMQTLAVIAWRQPVTRGDIEEIRGSAPHPDTYRRLMERGWIEVVGRRETLGRPELFGTTKKFLQDLGLKSLSDLPSVDDDVLRQEEFDLSSPRNEQELPLEFKG